MFAGSVVQGAIGFALGLIAAPLLVEAGFSLSQAVALTTLSLGIQAFFGAWQLRRHIPAADVKLAAAVRYLTMPLGVALLLSVETLNTEDVKRVVGLGVLLGALLRIWARNMTVRDLPAAVSVATFALSGLLQGLVAMGGPPMVLWMTTREWRAHQARAFTLALFLLNAPLQVLLLLFLSDTLSVEALLMALALTPVIFLGTTIGLRLGNRFSKPWLNRVAVGLLLLIAFKAII